MFAQRAKSRPDHFIAAKTSVPIPIASQRMRDALTILAVDPDVRQLGYVGSTSHIGRAVELGTVIVFTGDGRAHHLCLGQSMFDRNEGEQRLADAALRSMNLPPLRMTADDIDRQPRLANARQIWLHRSVPVGTAMRTRVLTSLADEGCSTLGELLRALPGDRDPLPAVMAMVCSGLLALDIHSAPIGPLTKVWSLS